MSKFEKFSTHIRKRFFISILFVFFAAFSSEAQHVSLSTNALQWANCGTVNLSAGVSLARHFSFEAGGRYNPFSYQRKSGLTVQNQQKTAFAGVRYWPWYVFSGWWAGVKGQWSDYSRTGIWRYAIDEGTRIGVGLSAGYTWMISKKVNLDFGIGGWGGRQTKYTLYHCKQCMEIRESGPKNFIVLDDVSVSLMIMF